MFLILFIFGLAVGSFLNVLALASVGKSSVLKKHSQCRSCKKALEWRDLFPVISFLLLKGRCRYCRRQISWQYILVELGTGFLFLALFYIFQKNWIDFSEFIFLIVLSCIFIVLFITDYLFFLLPDKIILAGFLAALIFYIIKVILEKESGFLTDKIWGLSIGAVFFLALFLITKGKGMGFGDVKLGALLGFVFGAKEIWFIILFAFVLGALVGIILMALHRKKIKDPVPFGPFLIIASFAMIFFGDFINEVILFYV